MQAVAHRMSHIKVGRFTQLIEVDIIDALKEMLAIFRRCRSGYNLALALEDE